MSLVTNANGFTAELKLTNGVNGATEVYINSTGTNVAIVEVPWPAAGVSGSAAASFTMGIENDPLSGGTRMLQWPGGSVTMTNLTGKAQNATNNWICVDGRYGVAAGPGGWFQYQAASGYTRVNTPGSLNESGAAEDTLSFVPTNALGARYAVWFPGQTALQCSNLTAQITWTVSGTNATLTFPGLGGSPTQIAAVVPAQLPLPAYAVSVATIAASSAQSAGYPATNAVDGNYSDFWVSLYGPTNHAEWLQAGFARPIGLAEFQIYPRTDNGGYGPSTVSLVGNVSKPIPTNGIPNSGTNFWSGAMAATSALDVKLSPPVYVTNVVLVITGAYDKGVTNQPRNVQVVEADFFERALPGTYADWELNYFTDAQLANPAVSGISADPDGDGTPNLLEFATGGSPWVADGTNALVKGLLAGRSQLAFQFQERNPLGNVSRQFQSSGDLAYWTNTTPVTVNALQNFGAKTVYQALFPLQNSRQYFRILYSLTN